MFSPGQIIKTFTSKKGNFVVVRTPLMEDVSLMTDFINEMSREDTFISFSGEQITEEEESKFVKEFIENMEKGNGLSILAFVGDTLISSSGISRQQRRSKHFGSLGISIKDGYREEGIGTELMNIMIDGAEKMKMRAIELSCFANNPRAFYLYEKMGFREVGRIPKKYFYKGDYIDSIEMVREL